MHPESRIRHCVITLLILFSFVAGFWAFSPVIVALPVTICAFAFFLAALRVFMPARGLMTLRLTTFALFATSVGNMLFSNQWISWAVEWLTPLIRRYYPAFINPSPISETSGYFCTCVTFLAFLATLYRKDDSAMGRHPDSLPNPLDEKDYRDQVPGFCSCLERDLNNIDKDSEWSDQSFVPLQATVEIRTQKSRARRITVLLDALRRNRDQRFFLVLGDPGSGKSVSLRKLARDLLAEVSRTRRIPVYVNLRDWRTPTEWSRENTPSPDVVATALLDWVRKDLRRRLDNFGEQFLVRYFDQMVKSGHFFFILDSFDEIGVLLDVPEQHEIIRIFSQGISQFLGGVHYSRGVLASRLFRKPTAEFDAPCELEIRPLSDDRIEQLARKRFAEVGFSARLFSERPDLAVAARNPFTASLLVEYLNNRRFSTNPNSLLPENRGELFDHYLRSRLSACKEQIERHEISETKLLNALSEIAAIMYDGKKSSFEIASNDLPDQLADIPTPELLDGLSKVRIIRLSLGSNRTVSFTHRRFAEYLIAQRWLNSNDKLPLEHIPTDSLWRDTLVLYCEIAPIDKIEIIAEYCVSELRGNLLNSLPQTGERWLRTLHILRFFSEAFRSRPPALIEWEDELFHAVIKIIDNADLLLAKWALEMSAVLTVNHYDTVIEHTLKREAPWLLETIFRQTDRLAQLSPQAVLRLRRFIDHLTFPKLWRQSSELVFALKLHPTLRSLRIYLNAVVIDSVAWPGAVIVTMVFNYNGLKPMLNAAIIFFLCWSEYFRKMQYHVIVSTINFSYAMRMFGIASILLSIIPSNILSPPSFSDPTTRGNNVCFAIANFPWLWIGGIMLAATFEIPWGHPKKIGFYVYNLVKPISSSLCHAIIGVALMLGVIWLGEHALQQPTWILRIAYGFIPGLLAIATTMGMIYILIIRGFPMCLRFARNSFFDLRYLWNVRGQLPPVNRNDLAVRWKQFRTEWGKLIFVGRLESIREMVGEWPDFPPYKKDGPAESRLARLEERWRRLN